MSFIMLLPVCAAVTAYADTEKQSVGEQIEEYVSKHSDTTAGMCVSVFNKTETIYSDYFGCIDLENNIAADENSVFEWGSITKLLVWTSVMQLYEQGKISLDEDINNYLPDNFLNDLLESVCILDNLILWSHRINHVLQTGHRSCLRLKDCKKTPDQLKDPEQFFYSDMIFRPIKGEVFAPIE